MDWAIGIETIPAAAEGIIDEFLERRPDWRGELSEYADSARVGHVP